MALTVPTAEPAVLSISDLLSGEGVFALDFDEMVELSRYLWSRQGARVPLYCRDDAPFETTSGTPTQTDESTAGIDLSRYTGVLEVGRELVQSSHEYQLTLLVYGQQIEIDCEIFAPDGNTSLATLTAACGSTWEWATATGLLTLSEASFAGIGSNDSRVLAATLEATLDGTTGKMWAAYLVESIGTLSQIPTS